MPTGLSIHLHCFSRNDRPLIEALVPQARAWVNRFQAHDLGSTDGTAEWLAAQPDLKLTQAEIASESCVLTRVKQFNQCWQDDRGRADWTVLLNGDEQLHHPDLPDYLMRCKAAGITAIRAIGYDIVSDRDPSQLDPSRPFHEQFTEGCRAPLLDRLVAFSPDAIQATGFAPPDLSAWPEGNVVWPKFPEVLLLRYRALGEQFFCNRLTEIDASLRAGDIESGWGLPASEPVPVRAAEILSQLRKRARTVPGLGVLASCDPAEYGREESILEASGLFDPHWYLQQNPDVALSQFEALAHFCTHGWREGRKPNPLFDPDWYYRQQTGPVSPDMNPLLHYVLHGEAANLAPSPRFDPRSYRARHDLGPDVSPLSHYLSHSPGIAERGNVAADNPVPPEVVSALPEPNPPIAAEQDLAMEMTLTTDSRTTAELPTWEQLQEIIAPTDGGLTEIARVIEGIKPLLAWLPFDSVWYLKANPDVAEAVESGVFESAQSHFVEHGFFEGRSPMPTDEES